MNDTVVATEPVEAPPAQEQVSATPETATENSVPDFDFNQFVDDLEEMVPETPPQSSVPAQPAQPATETPPVSAPAASAEPEQQAPVTPPATPPDQQQTTQVPSQPQQPQPEQTPEQVQQQMAQFVENGAKLLAEKVYMLDAETAAIVDGRKPSEFIPQLAGRLHMQILTAAMNQMSNMFGPLLEMHTQQRTEVETVERDFFAQYPQLKEHGDTVNRVARAYVQNNPNVSREQAFREIGTMSMVMLRLPLTTQAPQQQQQPQQQSAHFPPLAAIGGRGGAEATPAGQPDWVTQLITEE